MRHPLLRTYRGIMISFVEKRLKNACVRLGLRLGLYGVMILGFEEMEIFSFFFYSPLLYLYIHTRIREEMSEYKMDVENARHVVVT